MESMVPQARWTGMQPWRGLFGLVVTFGLSLIITVSSGMDSFLGLLSLWIMSMVPLELVMAIGWRVKFPPTESFSQPWRGFALTAFMFLVGTVACFAILGFMGGGVHQPLTSAYAISTVIMTAVAVCSFGMWPFSKMSVPARGFLTLLACYLIVLFGIQLYNFSVLSYPTGVNPSPVDPAPFYAPGGPLAAFADVAPKGPVAWESALAFWLWIAILTFTAVLFEFWPFNKSPKLMKQPVLGILVFASCMVIAYIAFTIGVGVMQVEPLRFMYIGVSYAFGLLMILVLFQRWPGRLLKSPGGAFLNLCLAIVIGYIGYHAVGAVCNWHFGKAMVYPSSVFAMGNLMLGINFPLWVAYADIWDFWPLPPTPAPH